MTSLPVADAAGRDSSVVSLHVHVLKQLQSAQRNLLAIRSVASLAQYLLEEFPAGFGSSHAELRLYDPEGVIQAQLPMHELFGEALSLNGDSYGLYQLYGDDPQTTILDLQDPRMFHILPGAGKADGAVMMPLTDGLRLVGSYHLALHEEMLAYGDEEREVLAMLSQLVAAAMLRLVEYQRVDQLALVDPVTEVGNLRAFRRDMLREINWARRVDRPVTLLYIALDDLDELCRSYGEVACHFVQRRVSQRLCSDLRATDYIAHTSETHFAVLLPGCNEPHGHDIGERFRRDIESFAIDDGRGAVLYVSLSIGLVCWEPSRHAIDSNERLAEQMEEEAESAMNQAVKAGGNRISVARLGLLML